MRDFVLADGDLVIQEGDFLTQGDDFVKEQRIALLLQFQKGDLPYDAELGVGVRGYMNGIQDEKLKRTIQLNLVADNFNIKNIRFLGDSKIVIAVQ
jgi:hypothetical protein